LMDDPVLKFDEFLLQPQQLLEIDVAIEGLGRGLVAGMFQQAGQPAVVNLQFQLFVDGVDQLVVDTLIERAGSDGLAGLASICWHSGGNYQDCGARTDVGVRI
jgi:hypothetical protein